MSRRQQPSRGVRVLVATVLLLLIGGLFAALSAQLIGGQRADLQRAGSERDAVPYLRSVSKLVADLVEARSAAVRGQADPPADLRVSMAAVSTADDRLGDALSTAERWAGLREAIDAVLGQRPTGVTAAGQYGDLVTMAIGLFDAVSVASQLSADSEPASRSLVVAARELRTLVAATGVAADATTLAAETESEDATEANVDVAVALADAASSYRTLVAVLTASVGAGSPAPFTATVTEQLTLLHNALEPAVGPAALRPATSIDSATIDATSRQARELMRPTADSILNELDGQLARRQAELRGDLVRGIGTAAAGLLLGLVVLWWSAAPTEPEEPDTDTLAEGSDVASVSVNLPSVDARELLALEELVHVGRGVRGRAPGGDDDAQ